MLTLIAPDSSHSANKALMLACAIFVIFSVEIVCGSSPNLAYELFRNIGRVDSAAQAAALWAPGRSDKEIVAMLGKPANVEGPIQFDKYWTASGCVSLAGVWNEARNADENWIYNLRDTTGNSLLVTLNNHRCTSVRRFDYMEHLNYQEWKAEQIINFATGTKMYDTPWSINAQMPMLSIHGKEACVISKRFGPPTRITETTGGEIWHYNTGYSTGAALTMQTSVCVSGKPYAILH